MNLSRIIKSAAIAALFVATAFGQGNLPSKEKYTKEEEEAMFKARLKTDPIPPGAIELELIRRIPLVEEIEKGEIFFRNVAGFSLDDRGHIFISESHFVKVYEFGAAGRLVGAFLKKGQGPGELQFPSHVLFHENQIIVIDGFSRRVNFYDRNWKFIRSFSLNKSVPPMAISNQGFFYAVNREGDYLIDVLDLEGNPVSSFGSLPSKKGSSLNMAVIGVSPSGSVWLGLMALGILKQYSPLGTLQAEYDLARTGNKIIRKNLKENLEWGKKAEPRVYPLIQNLSFIGEDILVQMGGPVQPIRRYDSQGRLKAVYFVQPGRYDVSYDDFFARINANGEEEFYVLRKDYEERDSCVGVYAPKKAQTSSLPKPADR